MKEMFEDANSVMVPDNTALREFQNVIHYGVTDTVSTLFGDEWDGVTDPTNEAPCLEPIDNDPAINALLAARNL